jgi:peptidoglycan/LPS O-acetylase OafA/YrhL
MKNRYLYIDIFRAVAIILVTGFHIWRILGKPSLEIGPFDLYAPFKYGAMGVTLFFVISGYCMALSIRNVKLEKLRTKEFYSQYLLKRIIRIIPAYYVAIIVWNILLTIGVNSQTSHSVKDNILHMLFLHNINSSSVYSISGVFWSIAVEMQFYFIFPLIVVSLLKFPKFTIGASIFLTMFSNYVVPNVISPAKYASNYAVISTNLMNYILLFVLGILLYNHREKISSFFDKYYLKYALYSLVLFILFNKEMFIENQVMFQVITGMLLGFVMITFLNYNFKTFFSEVIAQIGVYSYSIYLYNYIFLIEYEPVSQGIYGWIYYFVLIFAFGIFMYYVVEKPFTYLQKFVKNKSYSKTVQLLKAN